MYYLLDGFRDQLIAFLLGRQPFRRLKTSQTLPQSPFLYRTGSFGPSLEMLVFRPLIVLAIYPGIPNGSHIS